MYKDRKRRTAFTLVELLVVIGIIAVLVAILLPSLQKARTQAGILKCLSGERQAFMSVTMYAHDYKQYYPPGYGFLTATPVPEWHALLVDLGYMKKDVQTRRGGCPYGPYNYSPTETGGDFYTNPDISDLDPSPVGNPVCVSYGLNGLIQSGMQRDTPGLIFFGPYRDSDPTIRHHSTDVGLIFCVATPWNTGTQLISPAVYNSCGMDFSPGIPSGVSGRHERRGIPVTYCDGHGEIVPPYQVSSQPTWVPEKPLLYWSEAYLVYHRISPF